MIPLLTGLNVERTLLTKNNIHTHVIIKPSHQPANRHLTRLLQTLVLSELNHAHEDQHVYLIQIIFVLSDSMYRTSAHCIA